MVNISVAKVTEGMDNAVAWLVDMWEGVPSALSSLSLLSSPSSSAFLFFFLLISQQKTDKEVCD